MHKPAGRTYLQEYKWHCSDWNDTSNTYYFPNVDIELLSLLYAKIFLVPSTAGVAYIYPVSSTQVNCSGTVSAVEYCYTVGREQLGTEQLAFTLLTLEKNGLDLEEVRKEIEVQTTPQSEICPLSGPRNHYYCCDITPLDITDQLPLPHTDFDFGIIIPDSNVNLLGYNPLFNRALQVENYQIRTSSIPATGFNTISLTNTRKTTDQTLRLLRFHIGELIIIAESLNMTLLSTFCALIGAISMCMCNYMHDQF